MSNAAREYANALFLLAEEEGLTDQLHSEVKLCLSLFREHPAYTKLLCSPKLTWEEKERSLSRTLSDAHPHLFSLLCLMTKRGYAGEIPACLDTYDALWREKNGIALAIVESAVPLTEEETERLRQALAKKYGKQIELSVTQNPALLGGVRVRVEGELLDGTLRHRLDGIRDRLDSTVL